MMEIYNKLFKSLKHDDLILTPNKRLITFLHKIHASYQQKQKRIVWPKLLILQLEIWITLQWEKQLIQTNTYPYRLLTKNQEQLVWQTIIGRSATQFLMPDQIAKTAQQAWQLYHFWQIDFNSPQFKKTSETQIWKEWARSFKTYCQEHVCIDVTCATILLIDLFKNRKLKSPRRIFLIGFDEINPRIKELLQTLRQSGCEISNFAISEPNPCVGRLVLQNTDIELKTMARWAYQCWQSGKENIICAVPNLLPIRREVVSTFTEVFTSLNSSPMETYPFNVAGGLKISEFPMIQMALTILQLKKIHPIAKISKLLRSPYLGYAADEQSSRAQLDIYCRRYLENTIDLEQLAQISQHKYCQRLGDMLGQLIPHLTKIKQLPSQWAVCFNKRLNALAWPGQRQLMAEEFQLIKCWSELLEEFSTLDFLVNAISEEVALQLLNYLADETLFQANTDHEASIHVLGFLDTAGLCVDNLWIMGLDNRSWPTKAHPPNPFIPYTLQREQSLPHSSNERELYFASLLTQRLLKSAQNIVISHSLQAKETGHTLRPSGFITSIPAINICDLALPTYQATIETIWSTRSWEYYNDDLAPPFKLCELASIGNQLFKSQAACPFQAFAKYRLKSKFYPLPQSGLNYSERGTLLHDVIEKFWNSLTDQNTLLKQTEQSLKFLIKQAVALALSEFRKNRPFIFKQQFIEIEQERLQQRLIKLIMLEKNRPSFSNVIHENKQKLTFGKLPLQLRIDRLDTFPDGSTFIIDYKTSRLINLDWFDERLDEPQLALYCMAQPSAKGFAIIHICSDVIETQGFSEKENGLSQLISVKKNKNLPQSWSELLLFWRSALEKLAHQFKKGVANVDPKKGAETCRLCPLPLFCRINHHEKTE